MKPTKPKPFDINLSDTEREDLANDLCREVSDAFNARASIIKDGGQIDLSDWFYEQGRSDPNDRPFPGAADLTSYFITETVDAMQARLMKAVFSTRPFCFVEGWGQSAAKAPFVEKFHDWQVRKGDLKDELDKTLHGALIEDCYILEVSEKIETRRVTDTIDAALHLNEQGVPVMMDGKPHVKQGPDGEPIPANPGEPSAKIERSMVKTKRLGPQYDPISMKDFVFLPGHAKSAKQTWGHSYRVWSLIGDLQEKVKDGIYDKAAVELLGDTSDREDAATPLSVDMVASQEGPSVEKELFQVGLKRDLDGDGRAEWYIATISLRHRVLLRLKKDTFAERVGRSRCVPFVLFPRRDSVYGYSFGFNKLITLAEEHTSLRNMKADRSALATNAPIQQISGGLWDYNAQPIGIGQVVTVRSHDELKPMLIPDVPNSVVEQERDLHVAKERVGGLSDSASGVLSAERRTLGENKLAAGGSAVRVDVVIGRLQRAIAVVMQLSNEIWIDTLSAQDSKGIDAPPSVTAALQRSGLDFDGKFTADQLKGDFQFEPYGSDDTADPQRRKADFDGGFMALAKLGQVFPSIGAIMQAPEAGNAVVEQWGRAYNVKDMGPFEKPLKAPALPPTSAGMGPAPMGGAAPGGAPSGAPSGLPPALAALMSAHGAPSAPVAPPHPDQAKIDADVKMKQMELDSSERLAITLKRMDVAGRIEVARIAAAKQAADLLKEATEEAIALHQGTMPGPPGGAPPPMTGAPNGR